MNIFATAHYINGQWFAQPRAGHKWAIDDADADIFELEEGMEIKISLYTKGERVCKVLKSKWLEAV